MDLQTALLDTVRKQFLQQLLDDLNASWQADLKRSTIFTGVQQDRDGGWMLTANDGLGNYHIGNTFEAATMWFIQRARSLGIETAQGWARR